MDKITCATCPVVSATLDALSAVSNNYPLRSYALVQNIKMDLKRKHPEVFGHLLDDFEGTEEKLEYPKRDEELAPGYHKLVCAEPLILEPEDRTQEEWAMLCKLCGLKPENTARIVLNVANIETYIEGDK